MTLPKSKSIIVNPSPKILRQLAAQMTAAQKTEFGNFNITTKVTARSAGSTFFVSNIEIGQQRISQDENEKIAKFQDEYIRHEKMILIQGNLGPDPHF